MLCVSVNLSGIIGENHVFQEAMMSIQVEFDPKVQDKTGGAAGQTVTASTVREALYQVAASYPMLRLFNCEGEMRSVFHIRQENAPTTLDTPVRDGETVTLALG